MKRLTQRCRGAKAQSGFSGADALIAMMIMGLRRENKTSNHEIHETHEKGVGTAGITFKIILFFFSCVSWFKKSASVNPGHTFTEHHPPGSVSDVVKKNEKSMVSNTENTEEPRKRFS